MLQNCFISVYNIEKLSGKYTNTRVTVFPASIYTYHMFKTICQYQRAGDSSTQSRSYLTADHAPKLNFSWRFDHDSQGPLFQGSRHDSTSTRRRPSNYARHYVSRLKVTEASYERALSPCMSTIRLYFTQFKPLVPNQQIHNIGREILWLQVRARSNGSPSGNSSEVDRLTKQNTWEYA